MTKREEWERMIECVESDSVSKVEIIRFLKANQPNQPKQREIEKKLPCICGCRDVKPLWCIEKNTWRIVCDHCGKEAERGRSYIQAIRNWNEMIKKETENETKI